MNCTTMSAPAQLFKFLCRQYCHLRFLSCGTNRNCCSALNAPARRNYTSTPHPEAHKASQHADHKAKPVGRRMKAWQIQEYGDIDQLQLTHKAGVPPLKDPYDVLVAVHAASVNPIDVRMLGGYGANSLNQMRCVQNQSCRTSEFPLTLGRDFSGVVLETGRGVPAARFKAGDQVWGAGSAFRPGTHAQYHVVSAKEIGKKPESVSHIEAASLPYVVCTTWAALCTMGRLNSDNTRGKRVLILGGSGGLGTLAIQLLKAWGAEVTCTCSPDAIDLVLQCGADVAMDYRLPEANKELEDMTGFDLVYDTVSWSPTKGLSLLKKGHNAVYVSVVNSLLSNNSKYGLPLGMVTSAVDLGSQFVKGVVDGRMCLWAFFRPSHTALQTVARLVEQKQIRPIVDSVFPFEELPAAYGKVRAGHGRGKTVIDMSHLHDNADVGVAKP